MIIEYEGISPKIATDAFIAEGAVIIGQVEMKEGSSVWFNAVLRGDHGLISVGKNSNIQDCSVVHNDPTTNTIIGENVIVGHNAILHGTKIANNVIIGMGAILLNFSEIGENCIIGAGALISEGAKIPPGSLVLGIPGKVVRELKEEEISFIPTWASFYSQKAKKYREMKP